MPPKEKKMSLILAVSKNKLFGAQLFEGSVKGSDFGAFLINVIVNNEELYSNIDNVYFYLDNEKIHYSKILKSLL